MIVTPWTRSEMQAAHRVASKGRPYLYLASRFLDDPVQKTAFEVAYASMRLLDDAVDERAEDAAAPGLRERIQRWSAAAASVHADPGGAQTALAKLFRMFDLPLGPWKALADALLVDLDREGFETLEDFLSYAQGAAVGPGRVFAMLMTARFDGSRYVPHPLSHDEVFSELARFTYLVHGLRDLAEDLVGATRATALAPRADLGTAGLSMENLAAADPRIRNAWVLGVAEEARRRRERAETRFQEILSQVDPRGAFVLDFLVALYVRQLDRIVSAGGDVFSDAHRVPGSEVIAVAGEVFGRRPGGPEDWASRLEVELGEGVPRA